MLPYWETGIGKKQTMSQKLKRRRKTRLKLYYKSNPSDEMEFGSLSADRDRCNDNFP